MNRKMVQWLYQQLPELVSKGVLSQASADGLRAHYGDAKGMDKKWLVIMLCSVMGALLIGLGVILLFAHNWEDLSRPVRAVFSLLPLMVGQALAMWVILKKPSSQAFKESSAIFLSLMVGSSMALIGQTYNIPGDTPAFLLTWMLLIVPLVYFLEATIPAVIYVVGISAWAGHFWDDPLQAVLFWPLLGVVVPYFIWSLRQEKYTLRAAVLALAMGVGVLVGAGFTLGRTLPGSWIFVYSSLITIFYLLGVWEFQGVSTNWQRPFRVLGGIGVFIMMFTLTQRDAWESMAKRYSFAPHDMLSWASVPDHVLTFMLVSGALLLFIEYVKRQDWMRASFGALPLCALIGYAMAGTSTVWPMLMFNVYVFFVSVFRLMAGMRTNNLGVINTGMFMLAALVLARFFDSDINFVIKGLVFIFIGIGFLVTNVVILRRKGGAV